MFVNILNLNQVTMAIVSPCNDLVHEIDSPVVSWFLNKFQKT